MPLFHSAHYAQGGGALEGATGRRHRRGGRVQIWGASTTRTRPAICRPPSCQRCSCTGARCNMPSAPWTRTTLGPSSARSLKTCACALAATCRPSRWTRCCICARHTAQIVVRTRPFCSNGRAGTGTGPSATARGILLGVGPSCARKCSRACCGTRCPRTRALMAHKNVADHARV